jgi:hypothetical protein
MEGFSFAFGARNCSGRKGSAEFATVRSGTMDGSAGFGAGFIGVTCVGFWCGVGMRTALTTMGRVRG